MEKRLNASIIFLRERQTLDKSNCDKNNQDISCQETNQNVIKITENHNSLNNNILQTKYIRDYLIRKVFTEDDFIEVRCAVVGNFTNKIFSKIILI